ncbi:MAG: glycosyltransferase family 4 protein [Flammeovirgaceae bacterium]|nr:glycosyltransferase family 4 protein [Flammeovirgaceae bacterium]MDW8288370.1 glycosyltransferase family 4 protein [Flammeovirgaceae bacterium]
MKKKIGVVGNSAWNIYNFRQNLIKHLLTEGYDIVTIAPDDGYGKHLEKLGCLYQPVHMQPKGNNPLKDLLFAKDLYYCYRHHKLDAVLQFTIKPNIYGSLAAKLAGIPCINNVTGLGTVFLHNNLTTKIAKILYKISFRFPYRIFFQNEDDRSLFLKLGLVREEKTALIPGSGVDLEKFLPSPSFTRNHPFVFLMIARLLYDKGIVEYAEAAQLLKKQAIPCVCKVLGSIETDAGLGVTHEKVMQWVEGQFIEHIEKVEDVRPYIAQADVVVLPSYREGTPRSLLEAASMAKPLIATNVPGCKEVVKDGYNGFLCHPQSATDLAEKMKKMYLLTDEQLKTMGQNSRTYMQEKFDQKIVFQIYTETLQTLFQNI